MTLSRRTHLHCLQTSMSLTHVTTTSTFLQFHPSILLQPHQPRKDNLTLSRATCRTMNDLWQCQSNVPPFAYHRLKPSKSLLVHLLICIPHRMNHPILVFALRYHLLPPFPHVSVKPGNDDRTSIFLFIIHRDHALHHVRPSSTTQESRDVQIHVPELRRVPHQCILGVQYAACEQNHCEK